MIFICPRNVDIDILMDIDHTFVGGHLAWHPNNWTKRLESAMSANEYERLSAHRAVDALAHATGLHSQLVRHISASDAGRLVITSGDGRSVDLPYEVKATIDRRDQLLSFKQRHDNAILITRALSRKMAEQCRELELQFIDHAGNCYLRQPGLFVFVVGSKETSTPKPTSTRGFTPATLRVVFAVLTCPSILNSNVRRIAEVASISHGAAGTALLLLEEAGFFTTAASGRRLLALPERWLDAWTEGYLGRVRPKLLKYRMSAAQPLSHVLERFSPKYGEVVLGGEAAAAVREFGLKPGMLTLYMDFRDPGIMRDLVQELKLRRDPEGNIELVDLFWNTRELPSFPTVPDALIYADLVGTADARTMEIAEALRKEIRINVNSQAG